MEKVEGVVQSAEQIDPNTRNTVRITAKLSYSNSNYSNFMNNRRMNRRKMNVIMNECRMNGYRKSTYNTLYDSRKSRMSIMRENDDLVNGHIMNEPY